jgi:hypothetical protein
MFKKIKAKPTLMLYFNSNTPIKSIERKWEILAHVHVV